MTDLQAWYQGLPPVTKWVFSLSAGFTLLGALGVVTFDRVALMLDPIYYEFQVRGLKGANYFKLLTGRHLHP